jgi:hypothetical protein
MIAVIPTIIIKQGVASLSVLADSAPCGGVE